MKEGELCELCWPEACDPSHHEQLGICLARHRENVRAVLMRWHNVAGTRPTDALEVALERSVKSLEVPRGDSDTDEAESLTLARAIVYLVHRSEGNVGADALVSCIKGVLRELVMVQP